ncbi:hypothetical protein DFH06DRAFT_265615 [Mycena polygramma]|nr:hypothetical protein DFH06DRAFT_265615 [Mycena polygramma]
MFKDARIFTIAAAEVTQVKGKVYRVNSPTEVTFTNPPPRLPFALGPPFPNVGNASTGHPPTPPPPTSAPSAPTQLTDGGSGMFAGAVNFSINAGEVISVESDYERRDSGTRVRMGMGLAQFNTPFAPVPCYQHTARDDTDDSEDDDRRSVSRGRQSRGRDYDHHPEPFYREDGRARRSQGHPMRSSSRSMPYPSPGSMGRRHSDSQYSDTAGQSRAPQNMQAEVPRSGKKAKGKNGRNGKRWRGGEERSDEGQSSHRISQQRSSKGYDAPEGMSSRRTN